MCLLCCIPFFAPLVYCSKFNAALSWITNGETNVWNTSQRRALKALSLISLVLWITGITIIVTLVVSHARVTQV